MFADPIAVGGKPLTLAACANYLKYQGKALENNLKPFFFPAQVIAPSRNLLNKEAFAQRQQVFLTDQKLQQILNNQQLSFPTEFKEPLPLKDHCVAMNLHFVKKYRASQDITTAATAMKDGCSVECGKTTLFYNRLFDENVYRVENQEEVGQFLHHMREITANSIDLMFSEEIDLNLPIMEILPSLENDMAPGEYLIPLNSHVISLIKDDQGKLYIFDPNHGTIDLTHESGKQWFVNLLKSHHVHMTENLILLRIAQYQENLPFQYSEIAMQDLTELSFEKGRGRWGTAVFQWRGKTFHLAWDSQTGQIYNGDSKLMVRAKCLGLVPKTLADAACRTIYHLALTTLNVLTLPLARVEGKKKFLHQTRKIKRCAFDIFRAPLYGILGTSVALYGIFKPFEGRRLYGQIERRLNRQNAGVSFSKKYYSARCFTPLNFGSIDDEMTINRIKKLILYNTYSKNCHTI